jgi:hypothetical protein
VRLALCVLSPLMVLLAGCPKKSPNTGPTSGPSDPTPIIIAALESASQVSAITGSLAEADGDYVGCITGKSLASALATTAEGIVGNLDGGLLPSLDVDISGCLTLAESQPEGQDVHELVEPIISASLQMVSAVVDVYSDDMDCKVHAWVKASLDYADQITSLVVSEVAEPDGVLNLTAVEVALADCVEEAPAPVEEAPAEEAAPEAPAEPEAPAPAPEAETPEED